MKSSVFTFVFGACKYVCALWVLSKLKTFFSPPFFFFFFFLPYIFVYPSPLFCKKKTLVHWWSSLLGMHIEFIMDLQCGQVESWENVVQEQTCSQPVVFRPVFNKACLWEWVIEWVCVCVTAHVCYMCLLVCIHMHCTVPDLFKFMLAKIQTG